MPELELDPFDELVLQQLRDTVQLYGAECGVYDTVAPANYETNTIVVEVPYLVFRSDDSITEGPRRIDSSASRERTFAVVHVGSTREQARAAGNLAIVALDKRRVDPARFPGGSWIRFTERSGIRREETFTGAGKVPLLYGIDAFTFVP